MSQKPKNHQLDISLSMYSLPTLVHMFAFYSSGTHGAANSISINSLQ